MPIPTQLSPAHNHLLKSANPSSLTPLDPVSSNFDRSILGIPAENDEYTRGLTFFFDPSTGQPSVTSTSEESEDPGVTPPYDPSRSSNDTSSRKVNTPQSPSDTPGSLHPQAVSSKSAGSSDGESSDPGAGRLRPRSMSAHTSAETSEAATSPKSTDIPKNMPTSGNLTTMSPIVDLSTPGPFGPAEDMSNPRAMIELDQNDFDYLGKVMNQQDSSRQGDWTRLPAPMDLVDAQIDQSISPLQSDLARGSGPCYEEIPQRTGPYTTTVAVRTPKSSRPRLNPMGPQVSTRDATEKAKSIEMAKLMRGIGVWLPCLVNHEPVSTCQR